MSFKIECPGCNAYTSVVARAVMEDDRPCPHCGLPADVIRQVQSVRAKQADDQLKTQLADALLRAGKAEGEVVRLREFVNTVRGALGDLTEAMRGPW